MPKIEIVKQQDLKDCGACALLSIIKYYKGYVPLEKIRVDTCTGASGTTAFHLIEAAKEYGFDAMGVKVTSINDKNIYLPAIAHVTLKNGLEHFVVIYEITKKDVVLMDPAKGKVKQSREDFLEIWDNIIILLTPKSTIICYTQENNLLKFFTTIFLANKPLFLKICLLSIVLMFVTIFTSFYFQVAVSCIQKGTDNNLLNLLIIIFMVFTILKVTFEYLKNYYLQYLNKNIDINLFSSILEHIFHLPLNFLQNRTTGEIVSRIQELNEIKNMASEIFTNLILNVILLIGAIVALFMISSKLLFGLCFVIIIYLIISLIFNKLIFERVKDNLETSTNFNTILVEHLDMAYSIRHLNLVSQFLYRLESKLVQMLKSTFNLNNFLNHLETAKNFVYELGIFFVITYGIKLIGSNDLEVLDLVTFNSLILYLFNPIKEIVNLIPKWSYIKASFQKLSDFLGVKAKVNTDGFTNIPSGAIKGCNVTYSYNRYSNILDNINFDIKGGEKVLLTGPSGCGKSTLCKIIFEASELSKGNIAIDGILEKDFTTSALQKNILYVGQNEKLFTGTIKENILCFRPVSEEKFLQVAQICHLEEIINKRPNRYQTLINASLNNLSGGEKQRIILARALLKDATIIILDEALSEVNIDLERDILDNINHAFPEVTMIYVTHKDVADKFRKVIDLNE